MVAPFWSFWEPACLPWPSSHFLCFLCSRIILTGTMADTFWTHVQHGRVKLVTLFFALTWSEAESIFGDFRNFSILDLVTRPYCSILFFTVNLRYLYKYCEVCSKSLPVLRFRFLLYSFPDYLSFHPASNFSVSHARAAYTTAFVFHFRNVKNMFLNKIQSGYNINEKHQI